MKRKNLRICILILMVAFAAVGFTSKGGIDLSHYLVDEGAYFYDVPTENEVVAEETPSFSLFLGKSYFGFKEALAFKESQCRYGVINEYGYMGKYQFGRTTLEMIGIYNTQTFLKNTKLQELAFEANTSRNKWILRKDIKRYVGRRMNGVQITESGILAAAHLAGPGNVKKFLRSGGANGFQDAFGTSIRYYLKKFSGYDTSLIEAERKPRVL